MSEEIVTLVDRRGRVIGSAERRAVRRDNLLHCAAAVLVRNSAGEIYLHRRSEAKDWAPGFHDCAAGGLLQHGEAPEEAASRELEEELGVMGAALLPLGTSLYEDDATRCFEHCFEVLWDGPVAHTDDEVAWGRWVALDTLDGLLVTPGWKFVPDTRLLLTRLAETGTGDYAALTCLTSRHRPA